MRQIDPSDQDEGNSRAFPSLVSPTDVNHAPGFGVLEDLHGALETLQSRFFEVWLGTWPDAIDWTAAVIGTHISDGLSSLTKSLEYLLPFDDASEGESPIARAQAVENEINKYFSQSVAYYFGEDAFAIRTQAYDDMLWVVLGWLESVKFIDYHVNKHYTDTLPFTTQRESPWYGHQFQPSFAHRARIFYELASKGWDATLCGGGMVWNPNLGPYKNAITNELFIAAAIGMYLYFPGDPNESPFLDGVRTHSIPRKRHDDHFLVAAVSAYGWLRNANMTNTQGLYVDGFHIKGWGKNGSIGTGECDVRNEMVYTYNQGVILSGLRGLWEGTGNTSYLTDGHQLVRNVIAATGWSATTEWPTRRNWSGLGRDGVLEDYCDSRGNCSQDSQGFKGIFFHHLTLFCEPLPPEAMVPGKTHAGTPEARSLHAQSCREYVPWIAHNANAALKTRNEDGVFGMWWRSYTAETTSDSSVEIPSRPKGAEDYRNTARVPLDGIWQQPYAIDRHDRSSAFHGIEGLHGEHGPSIGKKINHDCADTKDANDRGRGRTVETQGSGVAVVRALWEFVHMFRHDD
ncbi:MAG: hypothetical protein Q9165_004206 [Trypethelium subeluteriae]